MWKESKNKDFSKYYPLVFTIIFVIILFQYSFFGLESIFYDWRIKLDWGIGFNDEIVLITQDEESEEFLGEKYPYTYASHNRLFDKLGKDRPRLVAYFVDFSIPESETDFKDIDQFKEKIIRYKKNGGYFRIGTSMDLGGEIIPPTELQDLGYSLALLNIDNIAFAKDDVCRRAILNVSGEDTLHLWAANTLRILSGKDRLSINQISGNFYQKEADATFVFFRYYTSPLLGNGKVRKIPFHRVLAGNFPKGFFADKLVLIGPNYISKISDHILTPFNKEDYNASKLMLHAEIIESLANNKTISKVNDIYSFAISILIAIFLSIIISYVSPVRGLLITLAVALGLIVLLHVLFSFFGWWIWMTYPLLTVCVVYYVSIPFRAVVEYQRRYAMQEETQLLKKVEDLKRNFLSLMSHDLKTPVAKIAGIADILYQQYKSDKDLTKNLSTIVESTKELNKFITSILDLTKIESSGVMISKVSKDVNGIIEGAVKDLKYEASLNGVEVISDLSPLYPIELDVQLIKRAVSNLLENAIKYAGKNSTVRIKTWDDSNWVYIDVIDNGIGIPEKDLGNIFQKFYRVKADSRNDIKGSGLGLYLVKYFIDLHEGHISVSSVEGKETMFRVQLKNS